MSKSILLSGAGFLALFLLPGGAFAQTLNYSLTAGTDKITFSLPEQPTPEALCAYLSDCFSVWPVDVKINGTNIPNATVSFYTSANEGGLTILEGPMLLVNNNGPGNEQLFAGALTKPTLNDFSNLQLIHEGYGSPTYNEAFLLNDSVAVSPTPEPPSFLLFGSGTLVLIGWSIKKALA